MANILIIDDDQGVTETLSDILQEEGHQITSVATGDKGLDCVKKQPFHIVLLDLKLPDTDGLDALRDLIILDPTLRVIVSTGNVTLESAVKALKQGAYAYITKPLNMDELITFINQALVHQDLTEKKRAAEEEVRRLEEYNKNILASLPYSTMIFDPSLTVEYVNVVFGRDFNVHREEVLGRNLVDVLPFTPPQNDKIIKNVETFLAEKAIEAQEVQLNEKLFEYRLFYVKKSTLVSEKIGLIIRDITAEKKWQQQLIQSEKTAGIAVIAAGIAHEVNNPLAIITGMTEAILEEDSSDAVKKYIENIMRHVGRASEIIRRVNSAAVWARGDMDNQLNINRELTEAIKISRLSHLFDDVEILPDYQEVPPIYGSSGELKLVFISLIKNAGQAMHGKGRLYLKSRYEDGYVEVRIRDTGHGLKKEHLKMLFTPFFTTKAPGMGTGLGLHIAHRIVSNYGGSMHVESEEGKGATFIIRFPEASVTPG